MYYTYRTLKHKIPELNERALDERDFQLLCRRERIIVHSGSFPRAFISCYARDQQGRAYILLSDKLRGALRLFFGLYELAHYFLHTPHHHTSYHLWLRSHKDDFEAESLPLLAMLPARELPFIIDEYEHAGTFVKRMLQKRFHLLQNWQI